MYLLEYVYSYVFFCSSKDRAETRKTRQEVLEGDRAVGSSFGTPLVDVDMYRGTNHYVYISRTRRSPQMWQYTAKKHNGSSNAMHELYSYASERFSCLLGSTVTHLVSVVSVNRQKRIHVREPVETVETLRFKARLAHIPLVN